MAEPEETRLAVLLTRGPQTTDSQWALAIAGEAAARGVPTDIFLMDEGADLLREEWAHRLDMEGVRVTVCTQTVAERDLPPDLVDVDYAGQVQWGLLIRRSDRVLAFS